MEKSINYKKNQKGSQRKRMKTQNRKKGNASKILKRKWQTYQRNLKSFLLRTRMKVKMVKNEIVDCFVLIAVPAQVARFKFNIWLFTILLSPNKKFNKNKS